MNEKINSKIKYFNLINSFKISEISLGEIAATEFDYLFQGKNRISNQSFLSTIIWILSKIRLFNKPVKYPIVLIPMDDFNKRSLELYEPIKKNLDVKYEVKSVKKWLSRISLITFLKWLVNIPRINMEMNIAIEYLLQNGIIDKKDIFKFKILTFKHLLIIYNTIAIFKKSKIKSILVDWDHDNIQSLIVLAAKIAEVKTYTLIHGNICDRSFPILADICICWGPKQFEYFVENGTPKDKLVIGGNPRFKYFESCKTNLKESLKIGDKKVLLHFSQNFPEPHFDELVFLGIMEEGVKNCNGNWKLVVKTHPVQNFNLFNEKLSTETILLDKSISLEESLSIADLSIIVNSTTIIDSINQGVPVTIFHPENNPEDFQKELVEFSKLPVTSSPESISKLLNSISSKNIMDITNFKAQTDFINHYCSIKDEEAGKKIAELLTDNK